MDYVAWATGEPNFANDDENCVTMYSNSGRQDHNLLESALWYDVSFRLEVASCVLKSDKKRRENQGEF